MKKDKILLNLSKLEDLEHYKKLGISNFLFPLEGFSIGYNTFTLKEIEESGIEAYILINRILTDEDIDIFLTLSMPKNVKGLLIEDTGLFYALKNSSLELINFQNHLNNNYKTINYWLKRFDSLVLSTDITYDESVNILNEADKPLIVCTFMHPMIMYSRRTLVKNYFCHIEKKTKTLMDIAVSNSSEKFILKENNYGTAVFDSILLDIRKYVESYPEDKIKFYLFDSNFIDSKSLDDAINGCDELGETGFLFKKTVYRIGDIK